MTIGQLKTDAAIAMKERPGLYGNIMDIVSDALDEIEAGGSETLNCDQAADAITELCK